MKKNNIIREIKKGFYRVADREPYRPNIEEKMSNIYYKITKEFFDETFVIWSTSWINEFTVHQTFHNYYLLETSHDIAEHAFYKMKELGIPNVFLRPDKEQFTKYIVDADSPIIITNLILKAPTKKINKITVPALEKILVDLYSDKNIFFMYQGYELKEIFRNAIKKYLLNYTKLFHYARRRGKENEIKDFIKSNFKDQLGNVLND